MANVERDKALHGQTVGTPSQLDANPNPTGGTQEGQPLGMVGGMADESLRMNARLAGNPDLQRAFQDNLAKAKAISQSQGGRPTR